MNYKIKIPGFIITDNETSKSWFAKKNDSNNKTDQILPMRSAGSPPPVPCPMICVPVKEYDGTIRYTCGCAILPSYPLKEIPHRWPY